MALTQLQTVLPDAGSFVTGQDRSSHYPYACCLVSAGAPRPTPYTPHTHLANPAGFTASCCPGTTMLSASAQRRARVCMTPCAVCPTPLLVYRCVDWQAAAAASTMHWQTRLRWLAAGALSFTSYTPALYVHRTFYRTAAMFVTPPNDQRSSRLASGVMLDTLWAPS